MSDAGAKPAPPSQHDLAKPREVALLLSLKLPICREGVQSSDAERGKAFDDEATEVLSVADEHRGVGQTRRTQPNLRGDFGR